MGWSNYGRIRKRIARVLPLSHNGKADSGKPSVIAQPDSAIANIYKEIARKAAIKIANASLDHSSKFPNIVIQNT